MKTPLGLLLLLLSLSACGESDDGAPPQQPPGPAPSATARPPKPAAKPTRTLGTARAMGTRPENLVLDPTFGSLGTQYSQAVIAQDALAHIETPATSPAGTAQPVLVGLASGAQPVLVFAVQGGTGPLHVRVYISTEDITLPKVSLITPDGLTAYDVPASDTGGQKHGDRSYRMYTTDIDDNVFGRLYLLVQPAVTAVVVAAPEVTSPAAPATMSLTQVAKRTTPNPAAARAARMMAELPVFQGILPKIGPRQR